MSSLELLHNKKKLRNLDMIGIIGSNESIQLKNPTIESLIPLYHEPDVGGPQHSNSNFRTSVFFSFRFLI
jgi:hypothetical protein